MYQQQSLDTFSYVSVLRQIKVTFGYLYVYQEGQIKFTLVYQQQSLDTFMCSMRDKINLAKAVVSHIKVQIKVTYFVYVIACFFCAILDELHE